MQQLWWVQMLFTILITVIASSGFWAFMQKKTDKQNAGEAMLIGLGHDRILYLGMLYIERGCITQDEYESLNNYLYQPYSALGGNGSAKRIMEEVDRLPIYKSTVIYPRPDRGLCKEMLNEKQA